MEIQQLKDPELLPSDEVLQQVMGVNFEIFKELRKKLTEAPFGFTPEWNYYRDGKAWLCKVIFKKKTILWLSVWENCFKVAFYFTEKHRNGINELDIDANLIEDFNKRKPIGKLLPLTLSVLSKEQIVDIIKITDYKFSNLS